MACSTANFTFYLYLALSRTVLADVQWRAETYVFMFRVFLQGNTIMSVNRVSRLAFQMEMQCVFCEQKLISYKFLSMFCYVPFDDGYCMTSPATYRPLPPITTVNVVAERDCAIREV